MPDDIVLRLQEENRQLRRLQADLLAALRTIVNEIDERENVHPDAVLFARVVIAKAAMRILTP